MNKFTPGPWKAVIYANTYNQPLIKDTNGNFIARLYSLDKRQHEANAKLISKAPEIYEAIKTMEQAAIVLADNAPTEYKNSHNDLFADVHNAHLKIIELLKEIE